MKKLLTIAVVFLFSLNSFAGRMTIGGDFTCHGADGDYKQYSFYAEWKDILGHYDCPDEINEWEITIEGGYLNNYPFGDKWDYDLVNTPGNGNTPSYCKLKIYRTPVWDFSLSLNVNKLYFQPKLNIVWDEGAEVKVSAKAKYRFKKVLYSSASGSKTFHAGGPTKPKIPNLGNIPFNDVVSIRTYSPDADNYKFQVVQGTLGKTGEAKVVTKDYPEIVYRPGGIGTDVIYITTQNECGWSQTASGTLNIVRGSVTTFIDGPTHIDSGTENIYYADVVGGYPPYSYKWYIDYNNAGNSQLKGTGSSYTFFPTWDPNSSSHDFYLVVTDSRGYTDEDYITVYTHSQKSGIFLNNNDDNKSIGQNRQIVDNEMLSIEIAPNPNNGVFNIVSNAEGIAKVKIFTMDGKIIYTKEKLGNNTLIDITNQPNGIYIIKVEQAGEVITQKISKN